MKKLFSLIIYFLPLMAFAQSTITQSALPVPGLVYVLGTDTTRVLIQPGGASQTWNYSSLTNSQNDTTGFFSSTGTLYQSSFPSSNLATYKASTDIWSYFTTDSTGLYANGIAGSGTPTGNVITLNPPQLTAPVPFTYNDSITNSSRIVIDTVVTFVVPYNARLVRNFQETFVADGWGTLILPSGTYNNVLRAKITEVRWDSAYYDPLSNGNYVPAPSLAFTPTVAHTTTYRWVQDQQPSYLLGITADSSGDSALYSKYLVSYIILGTHDLVSAQPSFITAFPNPASHRVSLNNELNSDGMLIVRNTLGQEVEKRIINHEKLIMIDVDNYANGIYQFTLVSNTDKRNGRFTVRH